MGLAGSLRDCCSHLISSNPHTNLFLPMTNCAAPPPPWALTLCTFVHQRNLLGCTTYSWDEYQVKREECTREHNSYKPRKGRQTPAWDWQALKQLLLIKTLSLGWKTCPKKTRVKLMKSCLLPTARPQVHSCPGWGVSRPGDTRAASAPSFVSWSPIPKPSCAQRHSWMGAGVALPHRVFFVFFC